MLVLTEATRLPWVSPSMEVVAVAGCHPEERVVGPQAELEALVVVVEGQVLVLVLLDRVHIQVPHKIHNLIDKDMMEDPLAPHTPHHILVEVEVVPVEREPQQPDQLLELVEQVFKFLSQDHLHILE